MLVIGGFLEGSRTLWNMDDIISRAWIRWILEGYRRLSQMDDIIIIAY